MRETHLISFDHLKMRPIDAIVSNSDSLDVTGTSRGEEDLRKLGQKQLEITVRHLIKLIRLFWIRQNENVRFM